MTNPLIGRHQSDTADPIAHRAARKRAGLASSWRHDAQMEAAAKLRDTRPADFDRMSPAVKTSLGYYERAKAAARAEGRDTDPPTAA